MFLVKTVLILPHWLRSREFWRNDFFPQWNSWWVSRPERAMVELPASYQRTGLIISTRAITRPSAQCWNSQKLLYLVERSWISRIKWEDWNSEGPMFLVNTIPSAGSSSAVCKATKTNLSLFFPRWGLGASFLFSQYGLRIDCLLQYTVLQSPDNPNIRF